MTDVLLDLNVLLDVFLARDPWLVDSAMVFEANRIGKLSAHISAISLPTLFYVVQRKSDIGHARRVVEESLAAFQIITVDRNTFELAQSLPGSDFEDNVQIAAAILAGVESIITRDATGFALSPLPILTPAQAIAKYSNHSGS